MVVRDHKTHESILILDKTDTISKHQFRGQRFTKVFIHKDNKDIDIEILRPNISVMDVEFGEIYYYG